MCDGTYMYPSKGGDAKQINPIIILCANKPIHMVYPNAFAFVEARFEEIEIRD